MPLEVDARTLRRWLGDGKEIALLDVRDGGAYARDHIVVATSAPRESFETSIPRLVPRRSTRVVVTDDEGCDAEIAAGFLESCGYDNVHVLRGGNAAWVAEGYLLFSGSNIVSKVFGEIVELRCDTPHIDASTLDQWAKKGRRFHLFDVRPLAEFRTVSIPGATNCPGMEVVLRIPAQLEDSTIPVVVNCAGRTRSIIGAQSLREVGLENPVFALENGTMGWELSGFEPDHGQSTVVTEPFGNDLSAARDAAHQLAERHGVRFVDVEALQAYLDDHSRTTYVFDVRLPEAFFLGRFPGSVNAPGGQLIQSTDAFAAVRNARIVVIDEHEVQAVVTAHWLGRMGWEVVVLGKPLDHLTEQGHETRHTLVEPHPSARPIDVESLRALIASDICSIVDVGESYWYRQGRISGSFYAMRSRIETALVRFPKNHPLVFCCSTGTRSPFAASDAIALGFTDVHWLEGGRAAWRRAGGDFESIGDSEDALLLTPTDDMWYPPWARADGAREAMREYLTWEVGLVDRLAGEEYLRFSAEFSFT